MLLLSLVCVAVSTCLVVCLLLWIQLCMSPCAPYSLLSSISALGQQTGVQEIFVGWVSTKHMQAGVFRCSEELKHHLNEWNGFIQTQDSLILSYYGFCFPSLIFEYMVIGGAVSSQWPLKGYYYISKGNMFSVFNLQIQAYSPTVLQVISPQIAP